MWCTYFTENVQRGRRCSVIAVVGIHHMVLMLPCCGSFLQGSLSLSVLLLFARLCLLSYVSLLSFHYILNSFFNDNCIDISGCPFGPSIYIASFRLFIDFSLFRLARSRPHRSQHTSMYGRRYSHPPTVSRKCDRCFTTSACICAPYCACTKRVFSPHPQHTNRLQPTHTHK